jgi:hypothetical protein
MYFYNLLMKRLNVITLYSRNFTKMFTYFITTLKYNSKTVGIYDVTNPFDNFTSVIEVFSETYKNLDNSALNTSVTIIISN